MRYPLSQYALIFIILWLALNLLGTLPGYETPKAWAKRSQAEKGRELVDNLNCAACHQIEEQKPRLGAPPLNFEGDRVRPEWLFGFLKSPKSIRPWLRMRMPTFRFTDSEALAITKFLMTQTMPDDQPFPDKYRFTGHVATESIEAAKKLTSRNYFDCLTCHLSGGEARSLDPDERAPDFSVIPQRLNPDWIVRWLFNPQKFQRDVKMPSFFDDEDSGPDDILDGDEERQILALRDFLVTSSRKPLPEGYQRALRKHPEVTAEMGQMLMAQFNCVGCHGNIPNLPPRREIAPSLVQVGRKVRVAWLRQFLTEHPGIRREMYNLGSGGRMPNFRLSPTEAKAITEYLRRLK